MLNRLSVRLNNEHKMMKWENCTVKDQISLIVKFIFIVISKGEIFALFH